MDHAEDAMVAAIAAIEKAAAVETVNAELLTEARQLHRDAQLRWDFIAAENSMGFHNPEEALRILAVATDLARQAELKAFQASERVAISITKKPVEAPVFWLFNNDYSSAISRNS